MSHRYSARLGIRTRRQRRQATRVTAAGAVLICVIAACSWWAGAGRNQTALAVARGGNVADVGLTSPKPRTPTRDSSVREILDRLHDYGDTDVATEAWFGPDASILPASGDDEPVPALPWADDQLENPFDTESAPTPLGGALVANDALPRLP